MAGVLLTIALLVLHRTSASPIHATRPHGTCKQLDIAISASAPGAVYNLPRIDNDIQAIAWAREQETWSAPSALQLIQQNITISDTYKIHAQICSPSTGGEILQIASHGLHYDSRYWDAQLKDHSYVDNALQAGYSILTYDRLGAGQSDHPDAYTGFQALNEVEILRQLTTLARMGTFSSTPPSKIVHVGHSFGSFITSAFVGMYPTLSAGAILTGFVPNIHLGANGASSWGVSYARNRPSGYVVASKPGISTFFFAGNFDEQLLDIGDATKQPIPISEIASGYTILTATGPNFTGPVQYMLAEKDFGICAGDCKGVANTTVLRGIFPVAAEIDVYVQPNTGHALPLHKNATAGFQVSFDFLKRNGL